MSAKTLDKMTKAVSQAGRSADSLASSLRVVVSEAVPEGFVYVIKPQEMLIYHKPEASEMYLEGIKRRWPRLPIKKGPFEPLQEATNTAAQAAGEFGQHPVLQQEYECTNNTGMEDSFDLGVTYFGHADPENDKFLVIMDKTGKWIDVLKERFGQTA